MAVQHTISPKLKRKIDMSVFVSGVIKKKKKNMGDLEPLILSTDLFAPSSHSEQPKNWPNARKLVKKQKTKIEEKSSISASKIPVTPICHGTLSRNFFERFDFVTKKVRFRDKPIFSLTHKIQFSDK